jgi:adenine-specific DNA-methyltransferase
MPRSQASFITPSLYGSPPSLARRSRQPPARATAERLGAVYTPPVLAKWMAALLVERLARRVVTVLDPACGDGSLLDHVAQLRSVRLVGVDCDPGATASAKRRLPRAAVECADGLATLAVGFGADTKLPIGGVIANPPWGAALPQKRDDLRVLGYKLVAGQVDSWDLFVEGIVRSVRHGTPFVLALPDALFLPEHRRTRELLATHCSLDVVARLGEGFFEKVCRGTVIVAGRTGRPGRGHAVSCIRLKPSDRKLVLSGQMSLIDATRSAAHVVPQCDFSRDANYRFSVDASQDERRRLRYLDQFKFPWDDWTVSGRGVELSKRGSVTACPQCSCYRPAPRKGETARCAKCDVSWTPSKRQIEAVVADRPGRGRWSPLIVGADVDRHACKPSRHLRLGVPGIKYKDLDQLRQRKLLVRKTGIGIKAAVDSSGAATTQVVFHFIARPGAPEFILDYLEGVLCSRVLLAWYLKQSGESEWRSHPYITQQVIRQFPVPMPVASAEIEQARAIADAVATRRRQCAPRPDDDYAIERLVAGMYRYTIDDVRWTLDVLQAAQPLEPIRTLRVESPDRIAPLCVRRELATSPIHGGLAACGKV